MRFSSLMLGLCLVLTSGAALAAPPHACDVVTVQEASQALGLEVIPPERAAPDTIGQTTCMFGAKESSAPRYVQISLLPVVDQAKAQGYSAQKHFASCVALTSPPPEPLKGIGDQAAWGGSGLKLGAGLHVCQGDYFFTVDVRSGDEARDKAEAMELARKILPRLDK